MPRGDGTGPFGQGPMTGGGFGYCTGANPRRRGFAFNYGFGLGFGRGRGFRRFMPFYADRPNVTSKETLTEEKAFLEDRLNAINKELGNLTEND